MNILYIGIAFLIAGIVSITIWWSTREGHVEDVKDYQSDSAFLSNVKAVAAERGMQADEIARSLESDKQVWQDFYQQLEDERQEAGRFEQQLEMASGGKLNFDHSKGFVGLDGQWHEHPPMTDGNRQ